MNQAELNCNCIDITPPIGLPWRNNSMYVAIIFVLVPSCYAEKKLEVKGIQR